MFKKIYLALFLSSLCVFFSKDMMGQIGGRYTFSFLELPASSRLAALGGTQTAVADNDPAFLWANPASISPEKSGGISFSQTYLLEDIRYGSVLYSHYLKSKDINIHGGVRYINYGTFQGRTATGVETVTFEAGETAFMLGIGKQLYDRLSIGVNMMFINSGLETYTASGLAFDLGLLYQIKEKGISIALTARNAGFQFKYYREDNREYLPLDVQLALSKRLEHLPFRFTLIYHHLNEWDINYYDPSQEPDIIIIGGEAEEKNLTLDNFARHWSINGELLLGKKEVLRLQLGYSHQRQKEMQLSNWGNLSGLSLGLDLKLKRFRFGYAFGRYHLAGGSNNITISTNLNSFGKNKLLRN